MHLLRNIREICVNPRPGFLPLARVIRNQLLRSGTSVGANYRAAQRANTIDLSDPGDNVTPTPSGDKAPLRIAVAAMISPKETFGYYRDLLDYIGLKMGRSVDLVQRDTYAEVNRLVPK
ncbi:MAG: hypothetical protein KKD28_02220 [Chloroflexi bacterium]|nr:hypothetical protein [Chloroflexota bacterium]